jgi:putative transcriptional regulator
MTHPNPASLQQPELGDLIRDLRQALGLTQEKFAAQVGVSFPTVNRWENKRATPSPLAMEKIAAMVKQVRKSGTDLVEKYGAKQA